MAGQRVKGSSERYTGSFIEVHKTENAVLLKIEGQEDDEGEWVPFSQIDKVVRVPNSRVTEVTMTAWIARTKGVI